MGHVIERLVILSPTVVYVPPCIHAYSVNVMLPGTVKLLLIHIKIKNTESRINKTNSGQTRPEWVLTFESADYDFPSTRSLLVVEERTRLMFSALVGDRKATQSQKLCTNYTSWNVFSHPFFRHRCSLSSMRRTWC